MIKPNRYSTALILPQDFNYEVLLLIPKESFKKRWNQLLRNFQVEKGEKARSLPTASLKQVLSYLTKGVVNILHSSFFSDHRMQSETIWMICENTGFTIKYLQQALDIWETTLSEQKIKPVNLTDDIEEIEVRSKTISIEDFEISSTNTLQPKENWIYDVVSWHVAKKICSKPLKLEKGFEVPLRIDQNGEVICWDPYLQSDIGNDTKQKQSGMLRITVKLITVPDIPLPLINLEAVVTRFVSGEVSRFYKKRTVYVDLAGLMQGDDASSFPILTLKLSRYGDSQPIWDDFSAEVFSNLGFESFPSASVVVSGKTPSPHVRVVHSPQDGWHRIGAGAGIYTYSTIAFHALTVIKNSELLKFQTIKGGIREILRKFETKPAEDEPIFIRPTADNWREIVNQQENGTVRILCLYQDIHEGRPRLVTVIKELVKTFSKTNELEQLTDGKILAIGPFEVCFIQFPEEQDTGLFKNIYLGSKEEAKALVTKYIPSSYIDPNVRQVALVETSWTGYVAKRQTNAKLLFRKLLASRSIPSQFLDITNPEKKESNLNALYELYRLAGLPLCPINIEFLPPNVWFFGINFFQIQGEYDTEYGGVITAIKNKSQIMKGARLFSDWTTMHQVTAGLLSKPLKKWRNRYDLIEEAKKLLQKFAMNNLEADNSFSAIIFVNGIPTRSFWTEISNKKAQFDDLGIFNSSLLRDCALIRINDDDQGFNIRIFNVKRREEVDSISKSLEVTTGEYFSLLDSNKLRVGTGQTLVFPELDSKKRSLRIAYFEGEEPRALRRKKGRNSEHSSRYNNPRDFWPVSKPIEITILNKGEFSKENLFKTTGILCKASTYWHGVTNYPLPLHLAHKICEDRRGKVREKDFEKDLEKTIPLNHFFKSENSST